MKNKNFKQKGGHTPECRERILELVMKSGKGQKRARCAALERARRARKAQGRLAAHRSGPSDSSCVMRFDDGHLAASPNRSEKQDRDDHAAHDCAGGSPGRTKAEGGRGWREEFPRSPANNLTGTMLGDVQAEVRAPYAALPSAAPCASCSESASWSPCPTAPIPVAASALDARWTPCSAAATKIEDPAPRMPQFAPSLSTETPPKLSLAGWAGCRGPRPCDEMGADGEIDPRLGRGGESSGTDAPLWPCGQCAREFRRKYNRDNHVLLCHVVPQLSKRLLPVAQIPSGGDAALLCLPCAQEMCGEGVSV